VKQLKLTMDIQIVLQIRYIFIQKLFHIAKKKIIPLIENGRDSKKGYFVVGNKIFYLLKFFEGKLKLNLDLENIIHDPIEYINKLWDFVYGIEIKLIDEGNDIIIVNDFAIEHCLNKSFSGNWYIDYSGENKGFEILDAHYPSINQRSYTKQE
jgi:hypothetical protein